MTVKEWGSDFHYVTDDSIRNPTDADPFFQDAALFFSGRSALLALLDWGIAEKKWKKVYVPSYYCQEVYGFLENNGIVLEKYPCNPLTGSTFSTVEDLSEHAIILVSYFGFTLPSDSLTHITKIADVTHDLTAANTNGADYTFGSLRKELPVPVGGFVKSAGHLNVPAYTAKAEEVALKKLSGMMLKKEYLEGTFEHKSVFRELLSEAETSFEHSGTHGALPPVAEAYIKGMKVSGIKKAKKSNLAFIKTKIMASHYFDISGTPNNDEFGLILHFRKPEIRNAFRQHLIKHAVYPVVLWPGQHSEEDRRFENTFLMVHCDFRYVEEDMEYIAEIINRFTD